MEVNGILKSDLTESQYRATVETLRVILCIDFSKAEQNFLCPVDAPSVEKTEVETKEVDSDGN